MSTRTTKPKRQNSPVCTCKNPEEIITKTCIECGKCFERKRDIIASMSGCRLSIHRNKAASMCDFGMGTTCNKCNGKKGITSCNNNKKRF